MAVFRRQLASRLATDLANIMRKNHLGKVMVGLLLLAATILRAQTAIQFTTLVSFNGTNGSEPGGGLIAGLDGNLYGTTQQGGTYNKGTIFKITTNGLLTTLASFDGTNGWNNFGISQLVQDKQGNLYGTTVYGGTNDFLFSEAGNVFKLDTNGILISLHSFNNTDGAYPQGGLVFGADGNLYGTTELGGTNIDANGNGDGTTFEISTHGTFKTVSEFAGTNGWESTAGLLQGKNGVFFGTTMNGDTNAGSYGTVFQLGTDGTIKTLFSFNGTNGAVPRSKLLLHPDGNLYGSTWIGGTNTKVGNFYSGSVGGYGTLFRLSLTGALTTLVNFDVTNGAYPLGDLMVGPDGNVYGTTDGTSGFSPNTAGYGTVFQLAPSGTLATLVSFNVTNGANPEGGMVCGPDGNFYGVTSSGGAYGSGTVFRLTVQTPVLQSVSSTNGHISFTWNSIAASKYQLQYCTNFPTTNWSNLGGAMTATNATMSTSDVVTNGCRFYRVVLVQ